ncbi:unnamed protein product [Protopolystoma xenopodis]|uniref:FERM domain-containing protein n=1 Tax=Protopolystoma xenopodis TaxID=117903 RepID=A0A3S5BSX7_9PLAT|nr:unnamed protein product [Protopolystoma xenopodis]
MNPSQSLRQQGIDEKEVLLLRRRYFFSDMNVDARDPVQLNLLYVQTRSFIAEFFEQKRQQLARINLLIMLISVAKVASAVV